MYVSFIFLPSCLKHFFISGCVPQGKPDSDYIRGLSVIGVQQIDRVVEVVEETLKGNQVVSEMYGCFL